MDTRAIKVFLACVLGGLVGSVVALSVHPYLWWVGLLAGGAVGYFSYEFKEVLRAIRVAAVFAWHQTLAAPDLIKSRRFRLLMPRLGLAVLIPIALLASTSIIFLILNPIITIETSDGKNGLLAAFMSVGGTAIAVATAVLSICAFVHESDGHYMVETKTLGIFVFTLSPIGFVALPLFGIGWVLYKSPKIAKLCAVFVKTLFLTIHSDIRLLCGVDAAFGALIGFYLMNPIIGAIAGGIIGLLNYKVVSQKWLRLHIREQNG